MAKVKCKYCGEMFDRTKVPYVEVSSRRYAHKECAEKQISQQTKDEQDYLALENYIMNSMGLLTSAKIKKQIMDYHQNYNMTFTGMLKTLQWFYDIKGGDKELANYGVGILPYIYDEACHYYYNLYVSQQVNREKKFEDFKPDTIHKEISFPKEERKIKLIDF